MAIGDEDEGAKPLRTCILLGNLLRHYNQLEVRQKDNKEG
jgi:hypothetical protein